VVNLNIFTLQKNNEMSAAWSETFSYDGKKIMILNLP